MNAPLRHPVVALKERPFNGALRVLPVDCFAERGPSIAEILAAQSDLAPHFREECVARLNGALVPRDMWPHVRLKPLVDRDVSVIFSLPIGGPGGGGNSGGAHKNPIATVASIAVLLAATVVSAGALGLPAIGLLGAGAVNAAAGAAIGIGGRLEPHLLANKQ